MAEKKNLTTKVTLQNLTTALKNTFVKKTTFNTLSDVVGNVNDKVTTLIGEDNNKSVRTIANEELAAKLIPANADEALDTLQEIAAWIQQHPEDASAMNAQINAINTKLELGTHSVTEYVAATGTYVAGTTYYTNSTGTAEVDTSGFDESTDVSSYYVASTSNVEYDTVKNFVNGAIQAALAAGAYATAANLQAAVDRITALETRATTIEGRLDTIESKEVTAATQNGYIKIGNTLTTVYVLPDSVLHNTDIQDFTVAEIEQMLVDVSFTLSANSGTVAVNGTTTFTATVPNTTILAVSSADESIATVSPANAADGDNTVYTFTVTGVAAGNTTITVKNASNQYDAQEYTITVSE